jgi:hypothetical protein
MSKSKRARPRKARATSKVTKATGRKSVAHRKGGNSKQDHVLHLLRRPSGATIENITQATGWQAHSVRGFLSGKLSKQLGLPVESWRQDGERVYALPSVGVNGATAEVDAAAEGVAANRGE